MSKLFTIVLLISQLILTNNIYGQFKKREIKKFTSKLFTIVLLISQLILTNNIYGQFKKREIKKFTQKYNLVISTSEKEVGHLLSFKNFSKGVFVPANEKEKSTLMTTMLLGSLSHLYDFLEDNKKGEFIVHFPNSYTSSKFLVEYKFDSGSVFVMRKMIYGNLFLEPFSAEDPNNYGLLFGFAINSENDLQLLINTLKEYWITNNIKVITHKNDHLEF
ncbi:hypothetical protein [Flammeovirga sp. SJP92]|uniref:hypothetical protein n=1 Tax=Flammeovirga sp. SJP92 TaxID=1775430 RepID=UPI000786D571|nr:hypothetical protein [Flammeovirga sp. SJP92]KXX66514.1 hypothetical protein AVL50_31810 [Flammeovirga sp. SJP92]